VRLYLAGLMCDRLISPTIFYESGWYDGQTWTKPSEVLTRERLIVTYRPTDSPTAASEPWDCWFTAPFWWRSLEFFCESSGQDDLKI